MKRALIALGVIVVVLVVAIGTLVAVTFTGRKPVEDGYAINGVRVVADAVSSVGIAPAGPNQVVLVDAGNDPDGRAILAELLRHGMGPEAVVAIFLTHGHGDHIAAVKKFPRADVMALAQEVALVEGRAGAKGPATRLFPVRPTGIVVTTPLHDGETVTVGTLPVRVFAVPGHTGGSAAYLINNVLFIGDSADTRSDGTLEAAPWIFSDSQAENRAALERLSTRLNAEPVSIAAIIPAHSGPTTDIAQLNALVARK